MPEFSHVPTFRFPPRIAWVSEEARNIWSTRLSRILRMIQELEWISVAHDVRPCALARVYQNRINDLAERAASYGLRLKAVSSGKSNSGEPSSQPAVDVFIGRSHQIDIAEKYLTTADSFGLGQCFGYPACCVARYEQQIAGSDIPSDLTWRIASLDAASETSEIDVSCAAHNIFLRAIGIRPFPHWPCSLGCVHSVAFALTMQDVAGNAGFRDETSWLNEVLAWPCDWSAMHGIIEVKTPVLKLCAGTDFSPTKRRIRKLGSSYPREGAVGLSFPYRQSDSPTTTGSPAFRRGLVQVSR